MEKFTLICPVCQEPFTSPRDKQVCCSRGCSNTYRKRHVIRPKCAQCGAIVYRQPSHCKSTVYCSKECESKHRSRRIKKQCIICGKEFEATPSAINRKYCSQKCMGVDVRKRVLNRSPQYRSFGECAIICLLRKNYPELQIIPNDRIQLNGYELDIWLPTLKIGIEYNGQHHYKPVYGDKVFAKTKGSDEKKRNIAKEKGLSIVTIIAPKTSRAKRDLIDVFKKCVIDVRLPAATIFDFSVEEVLQEQGKRKIFGTGYWKGKTTSEETKLKMSVARRKTYRLISPTGELVETNNLKQFCLDNSMQITYLCARYKQNLPCKGWCRADPI